MTRKAFFFDIDGTLVDRSGQLRESSKVAINHLQAQGYLVGLASGRSYLGSKSIAKELGIDLMVCDGGNSVYYQNQCVYEQYFPLEMVSAVLNYAKEKQIPYYVIDNFHAYGPNVLRALKQHILGLVIKGRKNLIRFKFTSWPSREISV